MTRNVLWKLTAILILLAAGCGTLPQRATPDPALVIGENAYTNCSELCVEREMCRELPDNQGRLTPIIHTRSQPGGRGFGVKYLTVGATVRLHEVQVNTTNDSFDNLAGDAMYLVSSPDWSPVDRFWVPVYCLSADPPPAD